MAKTTKTPAQPVRQQQGTMPVVAILVACIALIIGGVVGYAYKTVHVPTTIEASAHNNGEATGRRMTNSAAATLRTHLNTVSQQNIAAVVELSERTVAKTGVTEATVMLNANRQDFITLLLGAFGTARQAEIQAGVNQQYDAWIAYVAVVGTGDAGKIAAAKTAITTATDAWAQTLAGWTKNFPADGAQQQLRLQNLSIQLAVEAIASGNFSAAYTKQSLADSQASKFSDGLAAAIVRQYPNRY